MRPTTQRLARARELAHAARLDLPEALVTHLDRRLEHGEPSRTELLALLEGSPPFAARAIRMANSANVAPSLPVDTLGGAVDRLGSGFLARIARASHRVARPTRSAGTAAELAAARLVDDAVATARAACELARERDGIDPDAAFVGGLLRDVGQIVLLETIGAPYAAYLLETGLRRADLAAELALAGATHEDVGAVLAYEWNLPPRLGRLLGSHHTAARAGLAAVVAAGELAARFGPSLPSPVAAPTARIP